MANIYMEYYWLNLDFSITKFGVFMYDMQFQCAKHTNQIRFS